MSGNRLQNGLTLSANARRIDAIAFRLYAATKPKDAVAPITYGNATIKEPYVLPAWPVRAGADDHLAVGSKGFV